MPNLRASVAEEAARLGAIANPQIVIPRLGLGIHEFACNDAFPPKETREWQGQALP
jgi:hypothetical protein